MSQLEYDNDFQAIADEYLEWLLDYLEKHDKNTELDIDLHDGVLTIEIEKTGQQIIVNRHCVMRELWLSSPVSGALHFKPIYDKTNKLKDWQLPADNRSFIDILTNDLEKLL